MSAYNDQRAMLVQDLINTFDLYLEQPEHLQKPADLERFLKTHQIEAQESITQTMLDETRLLREQLRDIWTADSMESLIKHLNPLLAQGAMLVRLEADGDYHFHLQFEPQPGITSVQRLALEAAMGIVAVLQHYGFDRMRACAAEPCRDVFVDTSRNKSRRFCSDRCANRYNIAAFRDRQKGSEEN